MSYILQICCMFICRYTFIYKDSFEMQSERIVQKTKNKTEIMNYNVVLPMFFNLFSHTILRLILKSRSWCTEQKHVQEVVTSGCRSNCKSNISYSEFKDELNEWMVGWLTGSLKAKAGQDGQMVGQLDTFYFILHALLPKITIGGATD